METVNYETILKTIHNWPPAERILLIQDILKSLTPELTAPWPQRKSLEPSQPVKSTPTPANIPSDSLTARYRGLVQSPLSVAELTAAYEFQLMGDDEPSD